MIGYAFSIIAFSGAVPSMPKLFANGIVDRKMVAER
jgi:hypothetical protein